MASSRLKKKKARAQVRNKAREAASKAATEVIEDGAPRKKGKPASRVDLHKLDAAANQKDLELLGKPAKFVEARHCEKGKKYITWSKHDVVEFTGEVRRKTTGSYGDSVMGDQIEYMFLHWDMQGNTKQAFAYAPYYPLRDDATEVARIMERHFYKQNLEAARNARRAGAKTMEVQDPETGEIKEVSVREVRAKKAGSGAPRQDTDPRTGCRLGTTAHRVGEIMLDTGIEPKHRDACVAKLHKMLKEQFEDKKALNLARSWYATLKRGKPHIYGEGAKPAPKAAAKKVAEVTE